MWRLLAVECDEIFSDCPRLPKRRGPIRIRSYDTLEATSIRFDHARIHGEALPANKASIHATPHHSLEDMAEDVALAEPTMTVLSEGGVVGNQIFEAKTTEPAIGEVQRHVFAEPTLGADAETVSNDEHPHHQFRVDRWAACMTIKRCKQMAQITKVKHRINLSKQMTGRNPILKPKRVEELNLRSRQLTHHRRISSPTQARESRSTGRHEEFFHGIRQ